MAIGKHVLKHRVFSREYLVSSQSITGCYTNGTTYLRHSEQTTTCLWMYCFSSFNIEPRERHLLSTQIISQHQVQLHMPRNVSLIVKKILVAVRRTTAKDETVTIVRSDDTTQECAKLKNKNSKNPPLPKKPFRKQNKSRLWKKSITLEAKLRFIASTKVIIVFECTATLVLL